MTRLPTVKSPRNLALAICFFLFAGSFRGCELLEVLFSTNCSPDPGAAFNSLGEASTRETILVCDTGKIYIADTLCTSGWTSLTVASFPDLKDITFFYINGIGNIIVGDNGTLVRLTPDFQLEDLFNPAGSFNLNAISNPYPGGFQEDLVAVGDMGTVIRSTDAGLNWSQLSFPSSSNLRDCYISGEAIFVSGEDYSLYRSTDGGESWDPIGPMLGKMVGSQSSYNRIYFYDDNLGFVGGPHGLILKTTDGGLSWESKSAQGFTEVVDLYFISPDSGVSVGPGGVARLTTDGGESWFEDISVTSYLGGRDVNRITPFGRVFGTVLGSGGLFTFIAPDSTYLDSIFVTSIDEDIGYPTELRLHQNYPNPFNPSTTIRFSLPRSADVSLKVFNMLGEEVATLVSGQVDAGEHSVQWNATGRSSGVYWYRLQAGSYVETKKLALIR